MVNRRRIHVLLAACIAVVMVVATVMPVLAQQGAQMKVSDLGGEDSDCPDVAIDSNGNVHIVWEGNSEAGNRGGGNGEIWYTMLDNDGNTLIDDTLIEGEGTERKPVIGVDSQNRVHIVWQGDNGNSIIYAKIDPYLDDRDGDAANLTTIKVVGSTVLYGGYRQQDPRIAIDSSDNVHVVWRNHADGEIAYMKLNSGGAIVVNCTTVIERGQPSCRRPFVALDSNDNPHIIWTDMADTASWEIYYAMLNGSNGNHLIEPTLITDNDDYPSVRSDIVVDGEDKVHVFWSERVDDRIREIYYKKLDPSLDDQDGDSADDSTITVIDDTMVSSDDDWRSGVPQAAYQCGYIHLTWKDDRSNMGGPGSGPPADVFYMVLDTDGNVVVPETALTTGSALNYTHTWANNVIPVAVDADGKAHVAWCDHRTGDHEIWYTSYQGPACQYRPVGGEAYPVKPMGFIAPLMGLAIATVTGIFVIRRNKAS